jgi:hypothetical protein
LAGRFAPVDGGIMSYVMRYETWKKLTEVSFKVRSKYLRRVDNALEQYEKTRSDADRQKLKLALHQWKMSKGYDAMGGKPAWMLSDRNRQRAVETLDRQLFDIPETINPEVLNDLAELPFYGIEAWAEGQARMAMKEAREQALVEMFAGRKVVVKRGPMGYAFDKASRDASKARASGEAAAKAAGKTAAAPLIAEARRQAMILIQEILGAYPIEVATEVIKAITELMPSIITELAASIVPYLSLASSGSKAIYNTAQAIRSEYQWVVSEDHLDKFAAGDPYAAAEAIRRMIERKRNQYTRLAGIYTTDTAVRAAAIIADAATYGAPTVSSIVNPLAAMGKSIALLSLQIFLIGRDYWEKWKVNKVLADPTGANLSKSIFDTCPLLGCYFIAGSTTSNIINFAVGDIGATGWKLDVEVMVRQHIEPMIGYARDAISDARIEVEGLERSKAAVNKTIGLNPVNKFKKSMVSMVAARVPFIDDPNDYQAVAKKQGYQVVTPDVLKGRIQGQGPKLPGPPIPPPRGRG